MFKIDDLEKYATLVKNKLNIPYVDVSAVSLHIGSLVSYAYECAEDFGWIEAGNPYMNFNATDYALDILKDKEVIQLEGTPNSITDEEAVWLVNPTEFLEDVNCS
jgi:hypothetical protein